MTRHPRLPSEAFDLPVDKIRQGYYSDTYFNHTKRVLEVNPEHAAVVAMRELHEKKPDDARLEAYTRLLYDQAVLAEGSKVKDPSAFARRINELLARDARDE